MHLHGEAGGADQQGVARAQRELPDILSHYRPDDVFNFDETGLYYRQAVCDVASIPINRLIFKTLNYFSLTVHSPQQLM